MNEKYTGCGTFTDANVMFREIYELGVNHAQENKRMQIIDVMGEKYVFDSLNGNLSVINMPVKPDAPFPETINFYTLDGFVDYIKTNVEGLIPDEECNTERMIVHVVDHQHVELLSKPSLNKAKRNTIAVCRAIVPNIPFGRYIDSETFNTMLLSMFEQTENRDVLFKVTSSLVSEQKLTSSDDGVSQNITLKQGVSLACTCKFENPVPLSPYRTFSEVPQIESNFVMRVNKDGEIFLNEADGGAWKVNAVKVIRDYLATKLADSPVVVLA